MDESSAQQPAWVVRGKTIRELVRDLESFENQDMAVEISLDSGATHKPISIVGSKEGYCLIMNCEVC